MRRGCLEDAWTVCDRVIKQGSQHMQPPPPRAGFDGSDAADYLWGGEQLLLLGGGRGGALGGFGGSGALALVPTASGRLSRVRNSHPWFYSLAAAKQLMHWCLVIDDLLTRIATKIDTNIPIDTNRTCLRSGGCTPPPMGRHSIWTG